MPVGKLDTVIELQQATEVKSSVTGQKTSTWSTLHTAYAEVIYKSSGEGEKNEQITPTNEKTFRIRYIPGITQKMRIHDPEQDQYYNITGIAAEGRKSYLLLTGSSINVNAPV